MGDGREDPVPKQKTRFSDRLGTELRGATWERQELG